MKGVVAFTLAASLAASASAHGQHHHQRFHAKKNEGASPVVKRNPDPVIKWVVDATETVYQLNGKIVDVEEAEERISEGELVVIGESTPTFTPPTPPKPTTTTEAKLGAQFIESKSEEPETTTSEPKPTSTSEVSKAPKPTKEVSTSPGTSGGSGVDRKFPNRTIKCSEFPSDYGAVALDWLDNGGWSSLQRTPGFYFGISSIAEIHTGIAGDVCTKGMFCSYACPPGYQKTQWPDAQGATLQSIGGLWCNDDGVLELTREGHDTLCEKGEGGIFIKSELDEEANFCRTDYPGNEKMVIPAQALPGGTVEVCNPNQATYYRWDNKDTTAQIYVNKKGYSLKDACTWDSERDLKGAGDKAPLILGVGKARDKNTYIGLFQNLPFGLDKLDYNIEITGDIAGNVECGYKDGNFIGGGNGCTVTIRDGGKAIIRLY